MVETPTSKEPVAVIDIGSSGIRMVIAEIGPKLSVRVLENVQKPVSLGKDVFTSGRIAPATIREAIEVLTQYKSMLETYGVRRMHAIATNAVREAANRDNFIDQAFVRTGIDIEVIEGAEENRLNLIAVEHALEGRFDFARKNCLIIEVGTGSTEIIVTAGGEVALTRTLLLGPLRLPEQANYQRTEPAALARLLKRRVSAIAEEIGREFDLGKVDSFIAMGASMRFVAKELAGQNGHNLASVSPKDFNDFLRTLSRLSAEEISEKYAVPYSDAETLSTSLALYAAFLTETKADTVLVPMVSIRDGLLLEMAQLVSGNKRTDLSKQVIHSARSLGRKYRYDETHAVATASVAVKLFDALKEDHGLGPRERLLLEVAALLHDIGTFISATSHHKHSAYLIEAAEIFGLRKLDKDVVANVARYHRRSQPKLTHPGYMALPRTERAVVSKLAAIMRVAEGLDASHQQKCRDFTMERKGANCTLWVPEEVGDISQERQSLSRKTDMLPDILGVSLSLKQGVPASPQAVKV
jgi:exopolyphosphatase/guanosine-5'-triphosphate,3'-diphosphate pyrophosphatase